MLLFKRFQVVLRIGRTILESKWENSHTFKIWRENPDYTSDMGAPAQKYPHRNGPETSSAVFSRVIKNPKVYKPSYHSSLVHQKDLCSCKAMNRTWTLIWNQTRCIWPWNTWR